MDRDELRTVAGQMRPAMSAHADDLVTSVYRRMKKDGLDFIPVKSEDGQLSGIVARSVIETLLHEKGTLVELTELLEVKDFLDSRFVSIGPDEPLAHAVRLMKENQIHCLVVQSGCNVLGVLSLFDALPAEVA